MTIDCAFVSIAAESPDCNEDFVVVEAELGVFVVADGVGSRPAASLASRLASDAFVAALRKGGASGLQTDEALKRAAQHANSALLNAGIGDPALRGMSSTLTALMLNEARARAVHVGDCRLYCYSGDTLSQLTTDHNVATELGETDPSKARALQRFLSRALGFADHVKVDTIDTAAKTGDIFLLATDGLTKSLPDGDILGVLQRTSEKSAQGICEELRRAATAEILTDDVTFCVVKPTVERRESSGTA